MRISEFIEISEFLNLEKISTKRGQFLYWLHLKIKVINKKKAIIIEIRNITWKEKIHSGQNFSNRFKLQ